MTKPSPVTLPGEERVDLPPLRRINRAAKALLASDVECMSVTIERVVREIASLSEVVPLPEVDAESIVNSDRVIRTYASCEWDDLHDDGKLWIEAIVRETEARAIALTDHRLSHPVGQGVGEPFQARVDKWMDACFGDAIKADRLERCDRFIEEALELVQTEPTFTRDRAHALVDYVFGRDVGEAVQEVGGVAVTLAALCNAFEIDVEAAAETELARVWTKVDAIRAKQAAKPTGSALPIAQPIPVASTGYEAVEVRKIETVTGDFGTEPGEPFWRIEIGGYCADFEYELAARNFAAAIATLSSSTPAKPTGDAADLRELHTRLLEGDFYSDHDEASRLVSVLRCHVEDLERGDYRPTTEAEGGDE